MFAAAAVSSALVSSWVFPDITDNPNQPTNQHYSHRWTSLRYGQRLNELPELLEPPLQLNVALTAKWLQEFGLAEGDKEMVTTCYTYNYSLAFCSLLHLLLSLNMVYSVHEGQRIFLLPITLCSTPMQRLGLPNNDNFLEKNFLVILANKSECHRNDCMEAKWYKYRNWLESNKHFSLSFYQSFMV